MKIVIQLMLNVGDGCDMNIEQIKNMILNDIHKGLTYHDKDHIHTIEVLGD